MMDWRRLSLALTASGLLSLAACSDPPAGECTTPAECDDGNECTADLCDQGACVNNADNTLLPAQTSPVDCRQEICQDGRKVSINNDAETPNDNIPCTIDSCQNGQIVGTPDDGACGAAPDCRALVCDPNGALGIPNAQGCAAVPDNNNLPDDGADCTTDTCVNGNPVFLPDNDVCSFLGGGGCAAAACDPANQTTNDGSGCALLLDDNFCDDGNFCTAELCDPDDASANGEGCVIEPVAGNPTQIPGNCLAEVCLNGNPNQIPDTNDVPTADTDGIDCTEPSCNAAGQIVETPKDNLCDDGLSCTIDSCDAGAGCVALPDSGLCAPGQGCDPGEDPGANPTGCVNADTCPATLIAIPGQTVVEDTSGLLNDFAPSCANNAGAHPDLAFALSLSDDSDVILSASPTQGQALSLMLVPVSAGACGAELTCAAAGAGLDAELSIINLAAGDYALIVDGNGAALQQGTFELTVVSAPTVLTAGDLVINELLANAPGAVSDNDGEYVEIANPSPDAAVATTGLTLTDGTASINPLADAGGAPLIIPPGGFLVGVRDLDPLVNGGVEADFGITFSLNNTPGDNFRLAKGAQTIDQVNTTAGGFPNAQDGRSFQLDLAKTSAVLNDSAANWCATPGATYGTAGGFGTPGLPNESCTPPACTVATQAADCNDNNVCTNDLCVAGACQNQPTNGTPSDGFSCTNDTCVNGVPTFTPNNAACDDGVGCTVDACVGGGGAPGTGCQNTPDNGLCGPNESCDPVQDCQAGITPGDACNNAIPLSSGVAALGDTTGLVDDLSASCAGPGGADIFFTLTLGQVSTLTLDLESAGGDLSVALLEGACAAPRELACVDAPANIDTLEIRGLLPGTYLVVVDAGAGAGADLFELTATVTAGGLQAGDLLISELMANPNDGAANDTAGEFVEFFNPRAFFVATGDLRFSSDNAGSPLTAVGTGFQLVAPPGGFLLGARQSDPAVNGGLTVDFTFTEGFTNGGDTARIKTNGQATIDVVVYVSNGNGFPAVVAGESYNLDPDRLSDTQNDAGGSWCNSSAANGGVDYDPSANTNRGTPRQPNLSCPGVN